MTSNQMSQLNSDLIPYNNSSIIHLNELSTNHDLRNELILFYYKCKDNYQKYQKKLNICPVDINWERNNISLSTSYPINYISKTELPANLAALFYKYMEINMNNYTSALFTTYISEALLINEQIKTQTICYFNNKQCLKEYSINYNQYYFLQQPKFIGNR